MTPESDEVERARQDCEALVGRHKSRYDGYEQMGSQPLLGLYYADDASYVGGHLLPPFED